MAKGIKITKTAVDAMQSAPSSPGAPDGKARLFILWDNELRGFGCKLMPSGRKVYIVQYRLGGRTGRAQRVTIGTHGNVTADEARARAKRILGQVADKIDVAAERRREKVEVRSAPTIAELGARYFESEAKAKIKPSTLKRYKWLIKNAIDPHMGHRLVRDVVRGDVRKWHEGLAETPTQGNRALALLSTILNRAIDDGYRPDRVNPCEGVKPFREQPRKRYLTEKEIAALGKSLRIAETDGVPWALADDLPPERAKHRPKHSENLRTTIDQHAAAAIRLFLLTGARLGEILKLEWAFVDIDAGLLRLPDSKTGWKEIRLNAPAMAVLATLPRASGNPFVIPGLDKVVDGKVVHTHRADLKRPWQLVRSMAGLDDIRIHDLRHTVAATAVASNVSLRLIGGLLGHASEKTSARYAHLSDNPVRDAAEKVGARISEALDGKTGETAADVTPLRKKR